MPRRSRLGGTSCTWPSDRTTTPARRERSISARLVESASNSRVPPLPPSTVVSTTCRSSRPFRLARSCSSAVSSCCGRWLMVCERRAVDQHGRRCRRAARAPRAPSPGWRAPACRAAAWRRATGCRARGATARARTPAATAAASAASSRPRQQRREGQRGAAASLAQPLQQSRDVHLIGLVVAGQRVHHQVDAEPAGQLALPLAARHHRDRSPCPARRPPRRRPSRWPPMITEETPSLMLGSAWSTQTVLAGRTGRGSPAAGRTSASACGPPASARAAAG